MYKWLKNLKRPRQFIKKTMNERQKRICPVKEIPQFSKYKIEAKKVSGANKAKESSREWSIKKILELVKMIKKITSNSP